MNKNVFKGNWKQIRGQSKAFLGTLTDNNLDRAREAAAAKINKRVTEYETKLQTIIATRP